MREILIKKKEINSQNLTYFNKVARERIKFVSSENRNANHRATSNQPTQAISPGWVGVLAVFCRFVIDDAEEKDDLKLHDKKIIKLFTEFF